MAVEAQIDFTLKKTRYFNLYKEQLNERQLKVMKRMFDEGPEGFAGGLNARKYIGITNTSKATATRDLYYLLEIGALRLAVKVGGRSTTYLLNLDDLAFGKCYNYCVTFILAGSSMVMVLPFRITVAFPLEKSPASAY